MERYVHESVRYNVQTCTADGIDGISSAQQV